MTQRNQKGFSIIELLIVVAIIAILILVALPQYKKYIIRAQVSEGLSLAAGPKTELGVLHAEFGEFPVTITVSGGKGKYISTSTVTRDSATKATIEYTFSKTSPNTANAEIDGQKLQVIGEIRDGAVVWSCKEGASSEKVKEALPASCK